MHIPTSPALFPVAFVRISFPEILSIVSTTSLTEFPFPVPKLIV